MACAFRHLYEWFGHIYSFIQAYAFTGLPVRELQMPFCRITGFEGCRPSAVLQSTLWKLPWICGSVVTPN